ncbi:hypothetical protein PGT21_011872 [Puccinia graminis f. sp. tritici]|uniref:Uncharacterized protein n=1 Tax=Puccinia graminis f. sp. tritici TaxID=56615 RepID=A0A5B0PTM8_PUCGR|nr:hypothetical protein PGT21_011872 [Puccinia graminis f. sp. tritici]
MPAMFVTSIAPAATATVFSILPKHSCKRSGASTCDARPQCAGDPFVSSPTSAANSFVTPQRYSHSVHRTLCRPAAHPNPQPFSTPSPIVCK